MVHVCVTIDWQVPCDEKTNVQLYMSHTKPDTLFIRQICKYESLYS